MVKVAVRNVGRCRVLTKRKVERIVRTVIKSHGVSRAECSVTFLSDSAIKRLNRIYFKRNRPTDVIAFKLDEGVRLKGDEGILGDIVISVDRARCYAGRFGTTLKKELVLYLVHGTLHLLGYDDESPQPRERMRRKEREFMECLCAKPI